MCSCQFRIYAGVIANFQKPSIPLKDHKEEGAQEPGAGDPDEDLSDDDLPAPAEGQLAAAPPEPGETKSTSNNDEMKRSLEARNWARYQELLRQNDERIEFFVDKTEQATKIFFSSYYHDKGLLWLVL
jgi:hypothetical protein